MMLDAEDCDDGDTAPTTRRAHELCTQAWADDEARLGAHCQPVSAGATVYTWFCQYQYDTRPGESVGVMDRDQLALGSMGIDVGGLGDPNFRLTDMFGAVANTGQPCAQEGGLRDKIWRRPALK